MSFLRVVMVTTLALVVALPLAASCGSSSCPIDVHPLDLAPSRFVLDLNFQYIDQDQLRHGTHSGFVDGFETEHRELQTVNRITTLQLGWFVTPKLQLGISTPLVSRTHRHVELESDELEKWNFNALGDASINGRYELFRSSAPESSSLWLTAAVKLPTGARHEQSEGEEPEEAEVTLQPGSGSTDFTIGATYQSGIIRQTSLSGEMGNSTLIPYFISTTYRRNGSGTHGYRRGDELQLNVGSEYPLNDTLHLLAQVNGRRQRRDGVGSTEEDPALTGGTHLYASPGVRALLGNHLSAYGYVQIPIYEKVNGLQLVSRVNYVLGVQHRF